jgi:hypothetical protein
MKFLSDVRKCEVVCLGRPLDQALFCNLLLGTAARQALSPSLLDSQEAEGSELPGKAVQLGHKLLLAHWM